MIQSLKVKREITVETHLTSIFQEKQILSIHRIHVQHRNLKHLKKNNDVIYQITSHPKQCCHQFFTCRFVLSNLKKSAKIKVSEITCKGIV